MNYKLSKNVIKGVLMSSLILGGATATISGMGFLGLGEEKVSAVDINAVKQIDTKAGVDKDPTKRFEGENVLTITGMATSFAKVQAVGSEEVIFDIDPELLSKLGGWANIRAKGAIGAYTYTNILGIGGIGIPYWTAFNDKDITFGPDGYPNRATFKHTVVAKVSIQTPDYYYLTIDLDRLGLADLPKAEKGFYNMNFGAVDTLGNATVVELGSKNAKLFTDDETTAELKDTLNKQITDMKKKVSEGQYTDDSLTSLNKAISDTESLLSTPSLNKNKAKQQVKANDDAVNQLKLKPDANGESVKFDEANKALNEILNDPSDPSKGYKDGVPNERVEQVKAKIEALEDGPSKDLLKDKVGRAENSPLVSAKNKGVEQINNSSLSPEDKESAIEKIKNVQTPQEVRDVVSEALRPLLESDKQKLKEDIEQSKLSPEIKEYLKSETDKAKDGDELTRVKNIFDKLKSEENPSTDLEQAKKDAKSGVDQASSKAKKAIDENTELTPTQKAEQKTAVDQTAEQAKANVDQATDASGVTAAKESGVKAVEEAGKVTPSTDLAQAKKDAKSAIDQASTKAKKAIDENTELTPTQKAEQKTAVDQTAEQAKANVDQATDASGVTAAKESGVKAVEEAGKVTPSTDLAQAKKDAKSAIDQASTKAKKAIDENTELTPTQKAEQKTAVDQTAEQAKANVDQATDASGVTAAKESGVKAVEEAGKVTPSTDLAQAKKDAKSAIDQASTKAKKAIDENTELTPTQKAEQKIAVDQTAEQAKANVDQATDASGVTAAKESGVKAVEEAGKVMPSTDLDQAKKDAAAKRSEADQVKKDAETKRSEADQAKKDAETKRSEADQAKKDAETKRSEADQAKKDAGTKRSEADQAKKDAETKRSEADQAKKDAETKRSEANQAKKDAADETDPVKKAELEKDAAAKVAETKATELDAAAKVAETKATELDAAAKVAETKATELDAAAKVAETKATELDAAAKVAETKAIELDAAAKVAEIKAKETKKLVKDLAESKKKKNEGSNSQTQKDQEKEHVRKYSTAKTEVLSEKDNNSNQEKFNKGYNPKNGGEKAFEGKKDPLPQTGESNTTLLSLLGLGGLVVLGAFILKRFGFKSKSK